MLAVIDTNIWISAVLSPEGHCAPIVDYVVRGACTPVVCRLSQFELSDVLSRPRIVRRYRLQPDVVARLLMLTARRSHWIPDPPILSISRDPRDDLFVAMARASGAEYLVTRDDDLKSDAAVVRHLADSGCTVASVREFLTVLSE